MAATERMLAANGTAGPIRQKGKERGHFTFPRPPFLKLSKSSTSVGPEFFRARSSSKKKTGY